jgi:hypothetical protein
MKRAFGFAAVALCALALGAASTASASGLISTSCPAGSQPVASGSVLVTGDPVTGADPSNVWATADYTRAFQLYHVNGHDFCVTWRDTGTFTTVGGTSPAGRGSVAAGVTGYLNRTRVETFSGTWQPHGATNGSDDLLSAYFDGVSDVNVTWYADLYLTPANGNWGSRTGFPSYCDIVSV